MNDDRRASVRRQASLPFGWCPLAAEAATPEICDALGLPRALALQSRLSDLDESFATATGLLTDPRMADALRALDGKLGVLEEALLAQAPLPDVTDLELSADGLGFTASQSLGPDGWLGVHLVLPASYHIVCLARVTHCQAEGADGYRIGAEFHDLEGPVARRLTRFAISRDRAP